mgnify:CR=1 FL=1
MKLYSKSSKENHNLKFKSLEKKSYKNADMAKICLKLNGLSDMKYGIFKLDRSWDTKQILETLNDATKAKQNETMITF